MNEKTKKVLHNCPTTAMRPLLVAAGAWPSVPPRHRATAFVEAREVAADGAATTTRWTGGDDGSIVRWETRMGDADTGAPVVPVAFLGGHSGRVTALAVSETDNVLLSGDDDGVVCAWDTRTNACVARRDVSCERISCAVDAVDIDDGADTSPRVARVRAGDVSRALDPRTLRVIETSAERARRDGDSATRARSDGGDFAKASPNAFGARVAVPFDPDASLAAAWRAAAAPAREKRAREDDGRLVSDPADVSARATSCRLLRGAGVRGALAVGLEDGDVRVERPFARASLAEASLAEASLATRPRRARGTVTSSATVGGLLVTGSACGSVSFWDVSAARVETRIGDPTATTTEARSLAEGCRLREAEEEQDATASFAPSLVASLAHHARGVRAVAALPMASEDVFASDAVEPRVGGNRTGSRRLGISVDGEGVVGVFSVTGAILGGRANQGPHLSKRVRCEMLLRPRLAHSAGSAAVAPTGPAAAAADDDEDDDSAREDVLGDAQRDADVRLVWDPSLGVLTALRSFRARGGGFARDAVAYDVPGGTIERSLEGSAALALFAEARRSAGAAELRVGWAETGWTTPSRDAEKRKRAGPASIESERVAGRVARARVVDVVALLEWRGVPSDDARAIRRLAAAMHAWGRDDEADEAATDAFRRDDGVAATTSSRRDDDGARRAAPPFAARAVHAVVGVGDAVSLAAPTGRDGSGTTDPHADAERAVAVAACAARLAFVAAKRVSGVPGVPGVSGVSGPGSAAAGTDAATDAGTETNDVVSSSLGSLHEAVARLSTSRTFTRPEHLAAFARLRHSPCVPIRDAARALFRANATAPTRDAASGGGEEVSSTRSDRTLAESARAAVAAAEASAARAADAATHVRSRRRLESEGASRNAEALAEEAVDLSMPAVVAAATRVARADAPNGDLEHARTAEIARALLVLLAAPSAVIVADAASLLAEGIESHGWARALRVSEQDAALAAAFGLAEALGSVGGAGGGVPSAATERMTARHATGALMRALAADRPWAFVAHLASRLESPASAESPAHMSAFLALAEVARENPRALERHLDAVAAVVAAASGSAATPALRKTCRAGARALATDLAQHSGRVAYFVSRSRDVERLAVAVEGAADEAGLPARGGGGAASRFRAIHVYDLVVGAKARVLTEDDDEDVATAGESAAAAAAAASVMHAANELSVAFSATLGALALPAVAGTPPPRRRGADSATDAGLSNTTVSRARVGHGETARDGVVSSSSRSSPTRGSPTTPVRRSVDVVPSPDTSDGHQQYAAAAAAAAMALAANGPNGAKARGSRRSTPRASPRASPRVSCDASSPRSALSREETGRGGDDDASRREARKRTPLPAFALAFDDEGARLAGYRDAERASRVRVWHVSSASLFSRSSAFANVLSLGARVSGAVAGATGASGVGGTRTAGFATTVGCAESFLCGDTAAMTEAVLADGVSSSGDASRRTRDRSSPRRVASLPGVSLEWRGRDAVVLRRGTVEAAFGVKQ